MTSQTCVQHCSQLMLRSRSEQQGVCLADPLGCRQSREPLSDDDERKAIKSVLEEIFQLEKIIEEIDLVKLVEVIHTQDSEKIDVFSSDLLPPVNWVKLDDIGIGYDWNGVKLAVICAVTHPHLQAAVGLVIGINDARLTLGRIDYADAEAFVAEFSQQPCESLSC